MRNAAARLLSCAHLLDQPYDARRDPSGPKGRLPDLLEPKTSSTCFPARGVFRSPLFHPPWRGASSRILLPLFAPRLRARVCSRLRAMQNKSSCHTRWYAARMSSAPPSPCLVIAHVQNDYVMATCTIRNFPVTVSRCSSNRTGHARCRAQRSLLSRRFFIGRRQAACQCASDERKGECVA